MLPATRSLADYLRTGREDSEPYELEDVAAHESAYDPRVLQLKIKRKRQMAFVKKMLEDAGYQDLADMTTLNRKAYDLEE